MKVEAWRKACRAGISAVALSALTACGLVSDADDKRFRVQSPERLEILYQDLAVAMHSAKPCFLISPESVRKTAFNAVGSQVSYLRSRCFSSVAWNTGQAGYCSHVRSVSTVFLSGATMNAPLCRRLARSSGGVSSALRPAVDLPELMEVMGVTPVELDAWLSEEGRLRSREVAARYREDAPQVYWSQVESTIIHTRRFFDALDDAPAFGSAADRERMQALRWAPRQLFTSTPPEQRDPRRRIPRVRIRADSPGAD